MTYQAQRGHTQSEILDKDVLEVQKRVLGPEHPPTLAAKNTTRKKPWDAMQRKQSKPRKSEAHSRPDHSYTLNLAFTYSNKGRYRDAEALIFCPLGMSKVYARC